MSRKSIVVILIFITSTVLLVTLLVRNDRFMVAFSSIPGASQPVNLLNRTSVLFSDSVVSRSNHDDVLVNGDKSHISATNNVTEVGSLRSNVTIKKLRILLWTPFFDDVKWGYKELGRYPLKAGCDPDHYDHVDMGQCTVTDDRTLIRQADVVFFHCRDSIPDQQELTRNRLPHQIFIVFCLESPTFSSFAGVDAVGMNASFTYRLDSDFPGNYGKLDPKSDTGQYTRQMAWQDKTKSVVWLVSNCHTPSRREKLVKELSKHIDVDILGNCGSRRCLQDRSKCYQDFAKEYKFYLSFENSVCRDYVTEKFFLAMNSEMIPVVYGGANYSQHAPPHSYINARDFSTPRHLAEYLKQLANNETSYYEYFEWKKSHEFSKTRSLNFCDPCLAAARGTFSKISKPLEPWWKTNSCHNEDMDNWIQKW